MEDAVALPSLNLEYFLLLLYRLFLGGENSAAAEQFRVFWETYQVYASFVSLLLLTILVYTTIRKSQVLRDEKEAHHQRFLEKTQKEKATVSDRWQSIIQRLSSTNQNDWKLAVIEADILLDETLTNAGYHGDTLGEKLKLISKDRLPAINLAWEAHKVRNRIAHEPNLTFSAQEARKVLSYYQQVFRGLNAKQA